MTAVSGEFRRDIDAIGEIFALLETFTDGQKIDIGHMLARQPKDVAGSADIVGGLPRVTEIFEARVPKGTSDDLRASIVTVETGLCHQDSEVRDAHAE